MTNFDYERLTIQVMCYRNLKKNHKVVLTVSLSKLLTYTMEDIVVMGARFHRHIQNQTTVVLLPSSLVTF